MQIIVVLVTFVLLFCACQGIPIDVGSVPMNAALVFDSIDANDTTHDSEESTTILISSLPFASNLQNPCPSDPSSGRQTNVVAEERREEFSIEFYKTISDNSKRYRQEAQLILEQNVIPDCNTINVPNLRYMPQLETLQAMENSEALVEIYSSVIYHTAHAYFIRHQYLAPTNTSCTDEDTDESLLARKYGELAVKLKFLACIVRMGATAMGYPNDFASIGTRLLQSKISDLQLCSRRTLRDCQVLQSTIHLLNVIHSYSTVNTEES